MNRPRTLRWLRISFSAVCVVVCVLLVVLWVRSYWRFGFFDCPIADIAVGSLRGVLFMTSVQSPPGESGLGSLPIGAVRAEVRSALSSNLGFNYIKDEQTITFPHWSILLVLGFVAVTPWLPWSIRFSLYTLLIAVTLLSIGLGVVVYFSG